MTTEQRDQIIELAKKAYEMLGCIFPGENTHEVVEYLYDSGHGSEIRCLEIAITAHNLYTKDNLEIDDFFGWHGL